MNVPNPKETFVHTRSSKQYVIEMLSRDEATGKPLVTYTGVETGVTWTRPLEMFMGWAYGAPRYERMVNAQATEAVESQGKESVEVVENEHGYALECRDEKGTLRVRVQLSSKPATDTAEAPVRSQGQQITELVSSSRLMHLEVKVGELENKLSDVQSVLKGMMYHKEKNEDQSGAPHWNTAETLPPVGCELMIQVPEGSYRLAAEDENSSFALTLDLDKPLELTAVRACHVQHRGNDLTYLLHGKHFQGFTIKGQFAWTYP